MIMHIVHFFGSSKVSILHKLSQNTVFHFIVVLDCFSKTFTFRPLDGFSDKVNQKSYVKNWLKRCSLDTKLLFVNSVDELTLSTWYTWYKNDLKGFDVSVSCLCLELRGCIFFFRAEQCWRRGCWINIFSLVRRWTQFSVSLEWVLENALIFVFDPMMRMKDFIWTPYWMLTPFI